MCILGRMKAWSPLLILGIGLGIGACAEPPRRPPTTYVPLVRGPDTPSLPPGPLDPLSAPLGQDPSSSPVPVSPKSSGEKAEKPTPGNDPVNDEKCFRKVEGNCCAEPGVKARKQGARMSCPSGMILGAKCKGIGRSCHP